MKIKHWQGYGCVDVKRISTSTVGDTTTMHIRVSGNHECGIHRDDDYDLFNWLVRRFDKTYASYREWHRKHPDIQIIDGYENGTETCDYIFTY